MESREESKLCEPRELCELAQGRQAGQPAGGVCSLEMGLSQPLDRRISIALKVHRAEGLKCGGGVTSHPSLLCHLRMALG